MILVICEKPDASKQIAAFLEKTQSWQGYLEGQKYLITWAVGHIIELAKPEEYTGNKKWELKRPVHRTRQFHFETRTRQSSTNSYTLEIHFQNGLMTTYEKELPFYQEMYATGEIISEELRLLDRFFLPLKKVFREN